MPSSSFLAKDVIEWETKKKTQKGKDTKCNLLCALLIFWANYSWLFKVIRPVAWRILMVSSFRRCCWVIHVAPWGFIISLLMVTVPFSCFCFSTPASSSLMNYDKFADYSVTVLICHSALTPGVNHLCVFLINGWPSIQIGLVDLWS